MTFGITWIKRRINNMAGNLKISQATSAKARRAGTIMKSKDGKKEVARRFLPFYVRLPYYESKEDFTGSIAGIFLYAQCGEEAANVAAVAWNKWCRSNLIVTDFPKIVQDTNVGTTYIDDADYIAAWKDARKLEHYFIGHPNDPIAFMVKDREIFGVDEHKSNKYV